MKNVEVWGNIWEAPCPEIGSVAVNEGKKIVCESESISTVVFEPYTLDFHFLMIFLALEPLDRMDFHLYIKVQSALEELHVPILNNEYMKQDVLEDAVHKWRDKLREARARSIQVNDPFQYFNN